ncbi:MAG: hypothetical protein LBF79_00775, partial [Dysgonamonadaceae bacterium]|nr:hypothetical protein [Dysgonamonadaceae bacterium]
MKTICMIALLICSSLVSACDGDKPNTTVVEENGNTNENGGNGENGNGNDGNGNRGTHLKTSDYVRDIVNHPAFEGFGELLLARDNNSSYYDTR